MGRVVKSGVETSETRTGIRDTTATNDDYDDDDEESVLFLSVFSSVGFLSLTSRDTI